MGEDPRIAAAYLHARHAAWAGDVEHAISTLTRALAREGGGREQNPFWIIRERAQQLLNEMASLPGSARPDTASVIETVHLRGVIQRTGPREFELRAYLQDLDWEDTFWRRMQLVVSAHEHGPGAVPSIPDQATRTGEGSTLMETVPDSGGGENLDEEEDDDPAYGWWEVRSPLIVHVRVSEFALVSVKATWVEPGRLPDWRAIRHTLIDTLGYFEPGL